MNRILPNNFKKSWGKISNSKKKSANIINVQSNETTSNSDFKDYIQDSLVNNTNHFIENTYNDSTTQLEYKGRLNLYETLATYPEISEALDIVTDEIVNEGLDKDIVRLEFTNIGDRNVSSVSKKNILDMFRNIISSSYSVRDRLWHDTREFLIKGELYYEHIVDKETSKIIDMRKINPRNITPIYWNNEPYIFVEFINIEDMGEEDLQGLSEHFNENFNDIILQKINDLMGLTERERYRRENGYARNELDTFIKVYMPEQISYLRYNEGHSKASVTSYLENVRRPYNNLASMEAYLKIYRITRSTLQYLINVDTGTMTKPQREQFLNKVVHNYKYDTYYDPDTGELEEQKSIMTAVKHWWFTKGSESPHGTTVENFETRTDFNQIEDVKYYELKFLRSLKIPIKRWTERKEAPTGSSIDTAILQEELQFRKFINRVRKRINVLFFDMTQLQMIIEGYKEFVVSRNNYEIRWYDVNLYDEHVNKLIHESRADTFAKYGDEFAFEWKCKYILKMDENEWEELVTMKQRENEIYGKIFKDGDDFDLTKLFPSTDNDYIKDQARYDSEIDKEYDPEDDKIKNYNYDKDKKASLNYIQTLTESFIKNENKDKIG